MVGPIGREMGGVTTGQLYKGSAASPHREDGATDPLSVEDPRGSFVIYSCGSLTRRRRRMNKRDECGRCREVVSALHFKADLTLELTGAFIIGRSDARLFAHRHAPPQIAGGQQVVVTPRCRRATATHWCGRGLYWLKMRRKCRSERLRCFSACTHPVPRPTGRWQDDRMWSLNREPRLKSADGPWPSELPFGSRDELMSVTGN